MEKQLKKSYIFLKKMPSVSIILPVYNGDQYLSEAIQSIQCQTVSDFELIVVDDCSTDSSLQIAQAFAENDARIIVLTNKSNSKLPFTLNVGHRVASAEFITWTSHDNVLHPDFLEVHLAAFSADVDVTYGDYRIINSAGHGVGVSTVSAPENLAVDNVIGASFMYRKSVYDAIGGYAVDKFLYEDYDFWVRAFLSGSNFFRIEDIVYSYRVHDDSLSSSRPIPVEYYRYRYNLRRRFTTLDRSTAYRLRTTLFYNTIGVLSISEIATLVGEAFLLNPLLFVCQLVCKGPKLLRKL